MATLITKNIKADGTKDYTTVQAWEDAMPADLQSADEQWDGYLWGEIEETSFGVTNATFSGHNPDATRYWRLLNNSGEGPFKDNSLSMHYDGTRGAALKNTGGGSSNVCLYIDSGNNYHQVIGIQMNSDTTVPLAIVNTCANFTHDKILVRTAGDKRCWTAIGGPGTISRFCFVKDNAGTSQHGIEVATSGSTGFAFKHGSLVRPSNRTAGGRAFDCRGTSMTCKNVNVFGFTELFGGTTTGWTCDYNATDDTSFEVDGGHSLTSLTYASQFEQPDSTSTLDFRMKSGADIDGAGVADLGTDAYGTTYDSPPSIGPHELVAGGGGGGGNAWHYRAQEAAAA